MSATDLDSRIAGVLQRTKALPDDVAALLAEVERALADTERRAGAGARAGLGSDVDLGGDRIGERRNVRRPIPACSVWSWRVIGSSRSTRRRSSASSRSVERRAHADLVARRDELAARFESVWREHAEPLAAFLHEIAAIDEEIGTSQPVAARGLARPRETIARPGVGDLDSTSSSAWRRGCRLGITTRTGAASCCGRRSRRGSTPPRWCRETLRQREEAIAAEAREATQIASRLEEANRLSRGARRKVLAGSWG